ncbi:spore coat protein [Aneurinibacillus sp. Ricciae_BoGa-3]|uniref:spore coat protein n=1 Tax=Aneurinibacillus sp. Ricciae_BoGa-3 TaxID=3022697 RepID=UPI0023411269|nr:spore coat protein [Aneurinibacillus sp. Ricciae_BoGa-3]WCK56510.1 spore coat protein [Aneurinibacillus sp. Ricciae_BoGa-3]
MNSFIQNLMGMEGMTDQVIAADFLITAKSGVRNYAIAITEAATPEVRETLRRQFEDAILTHERITAYMMENGLYHAYNINEQIQLDVKNADNVQNLSANGNSIF